MRVIGLTGSFSTGKSTVAKIFKDLGAKVLSADSIVHQGLKKTGECYKAVLKKFGAGVLVRGNIDRKKLSDIVFNNQRKLNQLVKIVHPVVRKRVREHLKSFKTLKKKPIVVIEVPLLFESGFDKLCDTTIVVKTSRKKQVQRAIKQLKITKEQALSRIKAQMPLRKKIRLADIIIDNEGTKQKTKKQVEKIWLKLRQKKKR